MDAQVGLPLCCSQTPEGRFSSTSTFWGMVSIHVPFIQRTINLVPEHNNNTVKPVLSGNSKKQKTKVLKTDGTLMQVESIAECSLGAFCNTFDLH